MTTSTPYAAAWRESRRRLWRFLLGGIGGFFLIPVVMALLATLLGTPLPDSVRERLFVGLGLIWFVGCPVLAFRYMRFPCPRCGRTFYMRPFYGNAFARRCLHCGLPKGAPGPEAAPG
jgi:hypothetical protein